GILPRRRRQLALGSVLHGRDRLPPAGRRPALWRRGGPRPQPHRPAAPALPAAVARGPRTAALARRRAAQGRASQSGTALRRAFRVPPRPAPATAGPAATGQGAAAAAQPAALLADAGLGADADAAGPVVVVSFSLPRECPTRAVARPDSR